MKYCFKNADALTQGILEISKDLGFEVTDCGNADITVTVETSEQRTLAVCLDGDKASITYGEGKARFFRGLAILVDWVKNGECKKSVIETPLLKTDGAMLQQTTTMKLETVKAIFRKMAMMGMNAVLFYVEDAYEIEGYPYFGYLRGRYTHEELKELDAYALDLGIELIPCIQTLGHLKTHLRWAAAAPYRDTATELLVGQKETYDLIDAMLKTVSECFTTRRVHLGMDETKTLGTGAYLQKNGYRDSDELFFEHLEKVRDLAQARGLDPMMWSDMFFRLAGKNLTKYGDYDVRVVFTQEVKDKIPKGVRPVFWDYYHDNEDFYTINIDKHRDLFGVDPIFAGGVWTWSSYCPIYSRSLGFTLPALDACRKKGVEEIFATVWGGKEHSIIMSLAGLAWYADYDYKGCFEIDSVRACFERSCGVSYDEIMLCELPEHPDGTKLALTRALIFNDPLLGIVDKHIAGLPMQDYYKNVTKQLEAARENKGIFTAAYETILKISSLLENKADFGVRLKAAYDAKDMDALKERLQECDIIMEKVKAVRASHRAAWMTYNKPFGWEEFDNAFGGLIARVDTAKERIQAYLNGEIEHIEELEEQRLRLDGQLDENAEPRFHGQFLWMRNRFYTSVVQ